MAGGFPRKRDPFPRVLRSDFAFQLLRELRHASGETASGPGVRYNSPTDRQPGRHFPVLASGRSQGAVPAPRCEIDRVRLAASELVSMPVVPATVAALIRLNVFEALAEAGDGARLTADELAQLAMPGRRINVSYLRRMLRMLSCEKLFVEEVTATGERRFGLGPLGKFFVDDAEGGSFAPLMVWSQHPFCLRTWERLQEPVLDDSGVSAFALANGGSSMWECGKRHPDLNAMFNKAMGGCSKLYMRAVLDAYSGFAEAQVVVDVGGGSGNSLALITARHPHLRGINFDMPHVVAAGLVVPGVEHVGGDFCHSVPEGGDAILLQRILHDWDDETCQKILQNCCKALPPHGKVIVIDTMIPEGSDFAAGDSMAFKVDVVMLGSFGSDARERTKGDLAKLAWEAGFRRLTVVCKVDHFTVSELRKA